MTNIPKVPLRERAAKVLRLKHIECRAEGMHDMREAWPDLADAAISLIKADIVAEMKSDACVVEVAKELELYVPQSWLECKQEAKSVLVVVIKRIEGNV